MSQILITWEHGDEEHEEHWESVPAFLAWAAREGIHGTFRSFEEDEDGEYVLKDKGRF